MMDRRAFIKKSGTVLAGASGALSLPVLSSCSSELPPAQRVLEGKRWGMVIDLTRCPSDCTVCMDACREENNVAFHHDDRWDVHWIRKVEIRKEDESHEAEEKSVLLMCNHCDEPPCAQVCPVQATYKREDGIVLVDHHRCIGCRYCMIACPYNARFFNFRHNEEWPNKEYPKRSHGVVESCNFCAHLVDIGQSPACVAACPEGAMIFGNLQDPESHISRVIAENSVKRIREDWGTSPKVFYIGL